jgi:hypothetical protein
MSQSDFTKPCDRGERVPFSLVAPYAQAYIDRFAGDGDSPNQMIKREALLADRPDWRSGNYPTALMMLADRADLSPSTLAKQLRSREGTIGFFDADAILVAVGDTGLWRTDPGLCAFRDMAESLLSFDASEQEGSE